MAFDFEGALKNGATESDIRQYLNSQNRGQEADRYFSNQKQSTPPQISPTLSTQPQQQKGFDFQAALKEGASEEDIRAYLSNQGRATEADSFFGAKKPDHGIIGNYLDNVFKAAKEAYNTGLEESSKAVTRYINSDYAVDPTLKARLETPEQEDKKNELNKTLAEQGTGTKQTAGETFLQFEGAAAGVLGKVIAAPITPILQKEIEVVLPILTKLPDQTPIPSALTMGSFFNIGQVKAAYQSQPVQQGLYLLQRSKDAFDTWAKANPRPAADITSIINIAQFIPIDRALSVGADIAEPALKDAILSAKEIPSNLFSTAKEATSSITEKVVPKLTTYEANVAAKDTAKRALEQAAPKVQEAVTQGLGLDEATKMFNLNTDEKRVLNDIITSQERTSIGKEARDPFEIIGEQFRAPIKTLNTAEKTVGQKIGQVVKQFKGQPVIGAEEDVLNQLKQVRGLEDLSVGEKGVLNFNNTTISQQTGAQETIQKYFNAIKGRDALGLHRLRQELFEELGGKKATRNIPLTETEDKGLQAIRSGLINSLDRQFPTYSNLSTQYRKIEDALIDSRRSFQKVAQDSEEVMNLKAGELARRLTSHAGADTQAMLDNLIKVAQEYGYVSKVDVGKIQESFAILDKYFQLQKGTSLQSEILKGVSKSITKGVTPETLTNVVLKIAKPIMQNFEQTPESIRAAIKNLISLVEK